MSEHIRAGTANLARLMPETEARADAIIAELNSMDLQLLGLQEAEEWIEDAIDQRLAGDWVVVSDHVNCPALARADLFEKVAHNGKSSIAITMPGSVRKRYGSAALLRRKSDGLTFVFATIHPSNSGESRNSASDRIRQAESCWEHFAKWGVLDFPLVIVGDMNDRATPPAGLPGVFVAHGMTDVLTELKQKPRIDRAFVKGFTVLSATVNPVASSASDHDFGVFEVEPQIPEVRLHGVDVSSYQPGWTPTDSDSFVFVKATQGTTYRNPEATAQLAAARAKGLQVGHYHYLEPGDAVEQARYFAANADIHAGDLLVCDWEGDWTKSHPSVEDAAAFIAEAKRLLPENRCGLYCNRSDWTSTTVKAGDFLWIAEYGVKAPATKTEWMFWQYTDKPLDLNLSRFETLDELKAWARTTPPTPAVKPAALHSDTYKSDYVSWHGGYVTPIDATILQACGDAVGWGPVKITQGGLSKGVAASARTHWGLAVADIDVTGHKTTQVWDLCAALIRSGGPGFPRGFDGIDGFPKHIHWVSGESIAHGHTELKAQLLEFQRGGDGLVGNRRYYGPSVRLGSWSLSPYNLANVTDDSSVYRVNVTEGSVLYGLDVDRKIIAERPRGHEITATKRIQRWGRLNVLATDGLFYALDYLTTEA